MRHFASIVLCLAVSACVNEHQLHSIQHVPGFLPEDSVDLVMPGDSIDLVMVFDTSCSMSTDWPIVDYGLVRTAEDFQDEGVDVQVAMATMDSLEIGWLPEPHWYEVSSSNDIGWGVVSGLQEIRAVGGGGEAGIDGTIQAYEYHVDWFRDNASPVFILVSDEYDQSKATVEDLYDRMPYNSTYVVITGPAFAAVESECGADHAPVYHSFAHVAVNICVAGQWSILDSLMALE